MSLTREKTTSSHISKLFSAGYRKWIGVHLFLAEWVYCCEDRLVLDPPYVFSPSFFLRMINTLEFPYMKVTGRNKDTKRFFLKELLVYMTVYMWDLHPNRTCHRKVLPYLRNAIQNMKIIIRIYPYKPGK